MRRRQNGQALPLGIALILFSVLGGLVLYNTGQSATHKARLANAADAAAYSGLQWQARALNFAAYTNRAMVANQVSLAQAVTLTSWTTYGLIMAENLATVLSGIPIVNAIASGVETVMRTIDQIITPVTGAMLSVIDGINTGVSISQEAMYGASYLATPEIVKAVVEQTDPVFDVETGYTLTGVLDNLNDWQNFSEKLSNDREDYDKMRERASIIRDSQDEFTRAREWSFFNGFLYISPFFKVDIKKEGETRLIEREGDNGLEWEWKAKDNLAFHTKLRIPFRGWKGVEIPIGYGMAIANAVDDITIEEGACTSRRRSRDCETWARHNDDTESYADRNTLSLVGSDSRVEMNGHSGLNTFRRLSEESLGGAFPTLRLRVEVEMSAETVPGSNELIIDQQFTTPTHLPGQAMSSISIAEVYFKPPDADHADQQAKDIEFASLYSPWWAVRLAPIPAVDRLAAFTLRAGDEALSAIPGVVPVLSRGNEAFASESGGTDESDAHASVNGSAATAPETGAFQGSITGSSTGDVSTDERVAENLAIANDPEAALVDAARNAFGDAAEIAADEAADAISEALADTLESAVGDILNGIVSDSTNGWVTADDVRVWADDVRSETEADEQGVTSGIDAAVAEVEGLQDEYERLDAVVSERFEQAFEQQAAAYESRTQFLRSQISGYLGRPIGVYERVSTGLLSDSQRDTVQQLDGQRNTLIADLSVAYRDIVNEETDRFEMTFAMARDFVSTALATYDQTGGNINWSMFEAEQADETMVTPDEQTAQSEDAEINADEDH